MKKLLTISLLTAALCGISTADTIWIEDFESYANGTGIDGTGNLGDYPVSVSKWSLDSAGADLVDAGDYFKTVSGEMEGQDTGGPMILTTESISISGYSDVAISVDLSEDGDHEASDFADFEYRINGGTWTMITNWNGHGTASHTLVGDSPNDDDWVNETVTVSNLVGSTLDIRVAIENSAADEHIQVDNIVVTGTPANSAPALDVESQFVVISNTLSFIVTATDIDGDEIVLSATNLPSGAEFNTITNAGAVTNTFTWTFAAPTGTHSVTFYAADGTNTTSETIAITVIPSSVTFDFAGDTETNLYMALDGESGPVIYTNNGLVATFTASTGTMNRTTSGFGLYPNDTDAFDVGEWIDITFDIPVTLTDVNVSSWNLGVDQAVIYVNGVSNGVITATGNHTFKISVPTGQVLRIKGTAGDLGNGWSLDSITVRTSTNLPPVLDPIGNHSAAAGAPLSFGVIATDADDDDIILSATNLPSGATFNTVTNASAVTNSFTWATPTAGVYTITFTADDGIAGDSETITITVTNPPPEPPWSVYYNLPYQSNSGDNYPEQFIIRNALVERIDALESGDSAILATFTFSADEGAGVIINAMDKALDRGAAISFISENDLYIFTIYGGTNSLWTLSNRGTNPLDLVVDNSSNGIMHDKLGLFDYGGTNQWVFIASWNFTLGASAYQWNIALKARSPSLYAVYTNETAELLAGRFHDDPTKSHAHDGSTFLIDGSWGTNFARFSPPPATNSVENDITNLIAQAQSEIVFALNKLTREPIRDALVAAADRGVIIKGVIPRSDTDGDSSAIYSYLTNSANYATSNTVHMLTATAEADYSSLDSGEQDLVHAKYMVIDPNSVHAVVIHGSANWTGTALVNNNDNDENVVFLRHNGIAAEFYDNFQRITGAGTYSGGDASLVSWDFADTNRVADGGITANLSSIIARDASQTNYTYTDGALSANGWDDGAGTKYWETQFTTTNYTDIKVSSRQMASSTGPADFKLQYKTSIGNTYTDVPDGTVHVPDGGNALLTRLPLPGACDNQATVFLRWLLTSNTSAGGGTIGSAGAGRIDDIVVIGTTYVPAGTNEPPVIFLTFDGSQPGGLISIVWPTNAGSAFNVLTNDDLVNGTWGDANLIPFLDGDSYKTTNSIGSEPVLFYKLESQ